MEQNIKDVIFKSQSPIIAKSLDPTEADWALMKDYVSGARRGSKGPDDFVIFEDWLCFNLIDLEMDRFSVSVLNRLKETIIGKRKLIGHDWSGYSGIAGRYYKSRIEIQPIEKAFEALKSNLPGGPLLELQRRIAEADGGVHWLVASYYVLKKKESLIDEIDSGYYPSSIGIIGRTAFEVVDELSGIKYDEYKVNDRLRAVEGSFVGVEAQPGAESKALSVSLKTKEKRMKPKFYLERFGIKAVLDPDTLEDDVKSVIESVEKGISDMEESHKKAIDEKDEEIQTLKAAGEANSEIVKTIGEDVTVESVKAMKASAEAGEKYKSVLIDDVIKYGQDLGFIDKGEEGTENEKKLLQKMTCDELTKKLEPLVKKWNEQHPASQTLESGVEDEKKAPAPVIIPDHRFSLS